MSTDNQSHVKVTIGEMKVYLLSIGFNAIAEVGESLAFRHPESEIVVTLTKNTESEFMRPADFLSIKFRLENEGLISGSAVAQFDQGRLPVAS